MFFSKNSPFVLFSLIGATIISFTVQTVSSVPVYVRVYVCACVAQSFLRRLFAAIISPIFHFPSKGTRLCITPRFSIDRD